MNANGCRLRRSDLAHWREMYRSKPQRVYAELPHENDILAGRGLFLHRPGRRGRLFMGPACSGLSSQHDSGGHFGDLRAGGSTRPSNQYTSVQANLASDKTQRVLRVLRSQGADGAGASKARVDIWYYGKTRILLIRDALIIDVDRGGEDKEVMELTLVIRGQDCQKLVLARAPGSVRLALSCGPASGGR